MERGVLFTLAGRKQSTRYGPRAEYTLLNPTLLLQFLEVLLAGEQKFKIWTCGVISESNHMVQLLKIRKRTLRPEGGLRRWSDLDMVDPFYLGMVMKKRTLEGEKQCCCYEMVPCPKVQDGFWQTCRALAQGCMNWILVPNCTVNAFSFGLYVVAEYFWTEKQWAVAKHHEARTCTCVGACSI